MAASERIALSIVVPLYNEAGALPELVRRCSLAARRLTPQFELVLVDDGSTDGTAALLAWLGSDPNLGPTLRPVHLATNAGQYAATIAGLRAAHGECVVVLDGDLQDPPELIGSLMRALAMHSQTNIAFAVKTARADAAWMRLACGVLGAMQRWLAPLPTVRGAGSFCAMRRAVALRVLAQPIANANLGAVLAVLDEPYSVVTYAKQARAHGNSRVGLFGLFSEAWGSLAVTGALRRLAWLAAACALVVATAALAFARSQ